MAWLYLSKFGYETGSAKVKEGIRKFAAAKNATTLYHETITAILDPPGATCDRKSSAKTFEEVLLFISTASRPEIDLLPLHKGIA